MNLVDLLFFALATSALVTAWLHKGGLFAEFHLKVEAWGSYVPGDLVDGAPRWWPWIKHKIAFGLQCPVCLSFHFAFWLVVFFWVPGLWLGSVVALALKAPVYSLAITRLALIEHDSV